MNSRRQFIGSLVGTAACYGFFSGLPGIPTAGAIGPLAIAALAQTAIAVAGLFGNRGGDNGLGDLLQYQAQMLDALSKQMVAVEEGIKLIIDRLDELKTLIDHLPTEIDWRQRQGDIAGASARWRWLFASYVHDRQRGQFDPAKSTNIREMESVRDVVSQASQALMNTYTSYSLIPSICFAAYIESQARIILSPDTLSGMCDSYSTWLDSVVKGETEDKLNSALLQADKKAQQLRERVLPAEKYSCYISSFLKEKDPRDLNLDFKPKMSDLLMLGPVICRISDIKEVQSTSKISALDDNSDIANAATDLVKRKVLPEADRPIKVEPVSSSNDRGLENSCISKKSLALPYPSCADKDGARTQNAVSVMAGVAENAPLLLALTSLKFTAEVTQKHLVGLRGKVTATQHS